MGHTGLLGYNPTSIMESRRRSIVKSLSWRVFATVITSLVAYRVTGEITFAIEIGLLDTSIKLFAYYAHERTWLRINYGNPKKKTDYQI